MTLYKYIRLSSEDDDVRPGEKLESNSISNQRALLNDYIASQSELAECKILELCDDGFSGTNFDRPAVTQLLELAKAGKVDIIIVKDFSRFGRSHLDVGNFLEKIFPFLGIRFIAVNEDYDSKNEKYGTAGDLNIGVKSIINQMYSQDLSVRVKTSRRQYAERGEHITSYPIYGYLKSAEHRREWVVDPVAGEIVRRIFEWSHNGLTTTEIAAALNREGVSTPMLRKREIGATRQKWNTERLIYEWGRQMVSMILREERYVGRLLSGKTARYEVGNPNVRRQPKEKWIVAEDTHPPIVSEALFREINSKQASKAAPTRTPPKRGLFYRKLKCGYCGLALSQVKGSRCRYVCRNHGAARSGDYVDCANTVVHHAVLVAAVLDAIRLYAGLAANAAQQKVDHCRSKQAAVSEQCALETRMGRLRLQKNGTFQQYNSGTISHAVFARSCADANAEIALLTAQLEQSQRKAEFPYGMEGDALIRTAAGMGAITELSFEIVDRLIDKVRVFAEDRIEIVWKFENPFGKPDERTDENESAQCMDLLQSSASRS